MNNDILGYDCDGRELYEFDVIRAIWYSDIDFSKHLDVDPRLYCVIKAEDNKPYLVSVYDHWNKEAINRFEGRKLDDDIPIKIQSMEASINYEQAFDCDDNIITYQSNSDSTQLIKILNKKL